jgi:molecular chaperone IbpA
MTNNNTTITLRSIDVPSLRKFGVGFDNIFDELMRVTAQQSVQNYPPFNFVKHGEDTYVIEVAVAGFDEGDISITVEKQVLIIEGRKDIAEKDEEADEGVEYIHRGISSRNFARSFTLADHVQVVDASSKNGILSIVLERHIPEELKPKTVEIRFNK